MLTKILIAVLLILAVANAKLPALETMDLPGANIFNSHSQIANEIAP